MRPAIGLATMLVAAALAVLSFGVTTAAAAVPVAKLMLPTPVGATVAPIWLEAHAAGDKGRLVLIGRSSLSPTIAVFDPRSTPPLVTAVGNQTETYQHCDGNLTRTAGIPDDPFPAALGLRLSTPIVVDALRSDQFVFAMSMPAANVFWAGQPPPYAGASAPFQLERVAGTRCNYDQASPVGLPSSLAGAPAVPARGTHLPPPVSVKYRESTGELFVATDRVIVVVKGDRVALYFGDPTPLPAPEEPARLENASTVIPVTRPPMPMHADRLSAISGGIGSIAILNDTYLIVPENDNSAVRFVNFATGRVSVSLGASGGVQYWPPEFPCEITAAGCDALNFTIYSPKATAPYGATAYFVASSMFPAVYIVDTVASRVRFVVGRRPIEVVAGASGSPNDVFGRVNSLSVGGSSTLYIGTTRGLFYVAAADAASPVGFVPVGNNNSAATPPPPVVADAGYCDVWAKCSGHATFARGLPSVGCQCFCKRGWSGAACETNPRNFTSTHSLTHTKSKSQTPALPVPVPVPRTPEPVEEVAVASVIVTSVVGGFVNPTVATQGGRARVLLDLNICESPLGDKMDFTESPLGIEAGSGDLRYAAGAVAGNLSIIAVILTLQLVAVALVKHKRGISLVEAQAICRFPSVASFPMLFVTEGTTYAATLLIYYGQADVTLRLVGVLVVAGFVAFTAGFAVFMRWFFHAHYEYFDLRHNAGALPAAAANGAASGSSGSAVEMDPFTVPEDEGGHRTPANDGVVGDAPTGSRRTNSNANRSAGTPAGATETLVGANQTFASTFGAASDDKDLTPARQIMRRVRRVMRWLLDVRGKWREERTFQTKRFGGLFMDYRPGRQAFAIVELTMCITCGVLAALKPLHCRGIITAILIAYLAFFFAIGVSMPADNRFARATMATVAGLQALSAGLVLVADITQSATTATNARRTLYAAMFIVFFVSLVDAVTRAYYIGKYILRQINGVGTGGNRRVANATFLGDEPLLPIARPAATRRSDRDSASIMAGSILGLTSRPESSGERSDGLRVPPRRNGGTGVMFSRENTTTSPVPEMSPTSANAFNNFSFDNRNDGYAAPTVTMQPPTPRTRPAVPGTLTPPEPVGPTSARIGRNSVLEELRAELDEMLAGRAVPADRFDVLLEAARQSSSSGNSSSVNAGGHASSGSHRSSTGSLTRMNTRQPSNVSFAQLLDGPPGGNNNSSTAAVNRASNRSLAGLADAMRRHGSTESVGVNTSSSGTTTSNNSIVRRRPATSGGPMHSEL